MDSGTKSSPNNIIMSQYRPITKLNPADYRQTKIAIVQAKWNEHITSRLTEGALRSLKENGVADSNIDVFEVPGAVELTFAASHLMDEGDAYDAIIVFGCVVRGDTPHFDYVCQSVTQGITTLNVQNDVPVIFGVLTVENEQQALDRVGGPAGHKGEEAAETALQMVSFVNN